MKLVIAEKPSVAKSLAKVIGANKRCDGYVDQLVYQANCPCCGHMNKNLYLEETEPQYEAPANQFQHCQRRRTEAVDCSDPEHFKVRTHIQCGCLHPAPQSSVRGSDAFAGGSDYHQEGHRSREAHGHPMHGSHRGRPE